MQPLPPQQIPQPPNRQQQTLRYILRWLISTLAIFAAIKVVPGIGFTGPGWELGILAMIFGLINTLLRPLLTMLTCPLVILTLGLFGLVINAVLLTLTAQIAQSVGIDFVIDGFWPAFWGGLVISIVTVALSWLAGDRPNVRVMVQRGNQE